MPELVHPSLPLFAAALAALFLKPMGQRVALLLGADPKEVHQWYLAVYVDAVVGEL